MAVAAEAKRTCGHCGRHFIPDPRIGIRHRFCHRAACRKESRRKSHQKWLGKPENRGYHRGPEQVRRVAEWRARNPGYRQRQRKRRRGVRSRGAYAEELAAAILACGLQDLSERKLALVLGLVRRVCGRRLQDSMAAKLRRLMIEGYACLGEPDTGQD